MPGLVEFPRSKIHVIRTDSSAGAVPAAVGGRTVTWIERHRELDPAANTHVELGEGVLNLTCA